MPDYGSRPDCDSSEAKLRYFAVVHGNIGGTIDFYPEERAMAQHAYAGKIVGEFATPEEARSEVSRVLVQSKIEEQQRNQVPGDN